MKKFITCAAVIIFALFSVCAYQETYRASSDEYKNLIMLKELTGTAFPLMTAPISGSQMLDLLSLIDRESLNGYALQVYDDLKRKLEKPEILIGTNDIGLDVTAKISASVWKNTEERDENGVVNPDSIFTYKDRPPFLEADARIFGSKYFAAEITFNATVNYSNEPQIGTSGIKYSLPYMFNRLDQTMPAKAYASVGGAGLNLIVGRDRLSQGNGVTGNLTLGENVYYNDFLKFSFVKGPISYDFSYIVFSPYENDSAGKGVGDPYKLKSYVNYGSETKSTVLHRFSAVICRRVAIALTEGAMIYGKGLFQDIRLLNPFMFIHNSGSYYMGNTNNFFSAEASVPIVRGIEANAQFIFDQIQLSSEKNVRAPNAWGALANVKGSWKAGNGILSAYAEYCYGSEGLYLKELENDYDPDGTKEYSRYYLIDLVAGTSHFSGNEFAYLGYKHGGNLHSAGLGASYRIDRFKFTFDFFFKQKGVYGIGENEIRYLVPDVSVFSSGTKAYHIDAVVGCEANFIRGLKLQGQIASINALNYKHEKGKSFNDFQFSVFCTLDVTEFCRGLVRSGKSQT